MVAHVPKLEPDVAHALRALDDYFSQRSPLHAPAAAARWRFTLHGVNRNYDGTVYRLFVEPMGGLTGMDERGRPLAAYAAPVDALAGHPREAVPDDPSLVYRGMSWEEWQALREACVVRSRGALNIDQEGYTFFGRWPTAVEYATDYAPLPFRPTAERPGVVVAIPARLSIPHEALPSIVPPGEWAVRGALPASAVAGVWYLVPTTIRRGALDLHVDRRGAISDGYSSTPWQQTVVVAADVRGALRGCRAK